MRHISQRWTPFILFGLVAGGLSEDFTPIKCPPGIKKFGHGTDPRLYYTCGENYEADLKECGIGEYYHMAKQKCLSGVASDGEIKARTEKALGRNFQLGSLFDARLNMFYPESSLWNRQTLNNSVFRYDIRDTNIEVTTVTSTLQKMNSMDINANLAIDFMGGKVQVSGSGGYLKHESSSDDEAMVELNYHTVKYANTILKSTPVDYTFECNNPAFTHAVTSIKYGVDAYMVFSRMVQEHESKSEVTGELSISINLMGGKNNGTDSSTSGHGTVDITEEERSLLESTRLTMYGDISPEYKLPTTYVDALEFYQEKLPLLAGTKEDGYKGAQRVEVHLTPITDICGPLETILNDISDDAMDKLLTMLDELERLAITVNGLLNTREAHLFKPMRENLNLYKTKLALFDMEMKGRLMEILPNVRGGTGYGEKDLINLVTEYINTPFYYETSSIFLTDRKREIKAVQFLVDNFPAASNIAVADYESANDVEYIFERKEVVILNFNLLTTSQHTESFLNGTKIDEDNFWYNRVDINGEVGFELRSLWDFAMDNVDQEAKGYLVKLSNLVQDVPYTMNALVMGLVITDEFEVPVLTTLPVIYDIEAESFKFTIKKVNRFVTGVRIFVSDVISGVNYHWDEAISDSFSDGDSVDILVGGLKPAHAYSFNLKYLTAVGTSTPSAAIKPFSTRSMSQAQSLAIKEVTRKSIHVTWEPPTLMASPISLGDLLYKLTISGDNGYEKIVMTDATTYTLGQESGESLDLIEATKYTFTVTVLLNKELVTIGDGQTIGNFSQLNLDLDILTESVPVSTSTFSLPLPPTLIPVSSDEVTLSSAIVRWTPPAKLPGDSSIVHYVLEYTASNGNGTDPLLPGTTQRLIIVDETSFELTELSTGANYNFTVKVVTTEGESEFANNLFFSTFYNEDDIGSVRTQVMGDIEKVESDIRITSNFCGYKDSSQGQGVISYDSVSSAPNNVVGSGLDMGNGHFTAGVTGTYQVLVSLDMRTRPGEEHSVWVRLNDQNLIQSSQMHATLSLYVTGETTDNAGRSLMVSLHAGDTLALFHESNEGTLNNISFCVAGVQLY